MIVVGGHGAGIQAKERPGIEANQVFNSIESCEELKWEWNNLMDSICQLIEVLLNPDNPMEI